MCAAGDASYAHRVDDPANLNYCPVAGGDVDGYLIAALTIAVASATLARFPGSAPLALLALGAAAQAAVFYVNLGRFGNAFTVILGADPSVLIVYGLVPPLLFGAAAGLDLGLLRRTAHHALAYSTVAIASFLVLFMLLSSETGLFPPLGWQVRDDKTAPGRAVTPPFLSNRMPIFLLCSFLVL